MKDLKNLDLRLLRRILNAPFSVPAEALYLELGILNLETIIKARRLNYLHYLATRNINEMLYKFFATQWRHSTVGDWCLQARLDLSDFNLPEDLDWIKSKLKYSFKSQKICLYSFLEKKESHSKFKNLWYSDLEIQEYLKLETMSANEAKTVFSYRTRSALYSDNYRGSDGLSPCPLCLLHLDCQAMAFQCPAIRGETKIEEYYGKKIKSSVSKSLTKTLVKI